METTSPPDKKAGPILIEVNCPYCVAKGRRALLGKILKKRIDLMAQNAIKADGPGLDAIVDVIYYCRECDKDFVYGVIAV